MRNAYRIWARASQDSGVGIPQSKALRGRQDLLLRYLDCAVINTVHERRKIEGLRPYDTVRSAFIEGTDIYPNSAFKDQNHIQVCVRTIGCIKGYFHPLDESALS